MNLLDDPNSAGLLSLGLRLMSTPGKFGPALGQAGLGAMGDIQQMKAQQQAAKSRALQEQMLMMQIEEAKAAQARRAGVEGAYRNALLSPAQQALAGGGGPTLDNAAKLPGLKPKIDQAKLVEGLMQVDPLMAYQLMQPKPAIKGSEGDVFLDPVTYKPVASVPKVAPKPSSVQEFEYSLVNPGYNDWNRKNKQSGATNIGLPKIEVKTGESVAAQVGPMAKDSKIKAGGAITMFDAADRIEKALDSGLVTSGPMASKIQTVKQFAQVIGGGNDASIRQTQQVIRSLAKMAVEARKQLQGQGQVTENEAKAVERADGGDINDLTTGELRDLVVLTKRAAHFAAKEHADIMREMEAKESTRGLAPFFRLPGLDPLLRHSPQLPQIGDPQGPRFLGFEEPK